ncbi:DEKNAAC101384 [Brettanomyces naardenensis]|uniref:COX assembly mitochondrial protein n=1 Tax=Brettanomyces naardenensis TaxID=13370 RepID=A0A448YHU8_BRENA|nr:DEKNAAC101384 [Brettanomyces naardenensis]
MHSIIDREKNFECEDIIQALEECHKQGFMAKAFGKCTPVKQQLSMCLHETRMAEQRKKILQQREKIKSFEQKKKKLFEEEYGKDGYLKKVVEKEYELEHGKSQGGAPA